MEKTQRVAIGTVVMRNKQYLAGDRPLDGALAMSTMHFADEVVAETEIDEIPRREIEAGDLERSSLATQIIDSLTTDWKPSKYRDTYTEELRELIEAKAKGKEVTVEPAAETPSNVLDLMEALQASVDQHRKRSSAGRTGGHKREDRVQERIIESEGIRQAGAKSGSPKRRSA